MRSLIEPPGFARSDLIQTLAAAPNRRLTRMCGVLPMVSRMLAAFMGILESARGSRRDERTCYTRPRAAQTKAGEASARIIFLGIEQGVSVRLYVVQMFYSSLKESGPLVAEAKNT